MAIASACTEQKRSMCSSLTLLGSFFNVFQPRARTLPDLTITAPCFCFMLELADNSIARDRNDRSFLERPVDSPLAIALPLTSVIPVKCFRVTLAVYDLELTVLDLSNYCRPASLAMLDWHIFAHITVSHLFPLRIAALPHSAPSSTPDSPALRLLSRWSAAVRPVIS